MRVSDKIICTDSPCIDVIKNNYVFPNIVLHPEKIKIIMISEAPSINRNKNFYNSDNDIFIQPTIKIFNDAGLNISCINEILDNGIYITTAIKCPKKGMSVSSVTIKNCSRILETELGLFPNIKVIILNGDIAIKSMNYIAKDQQGERVIPAGSTYKIRKNKFYYKNIRCFPSYILTGKNLLIEKSKRTMITEDIKQALRYI